jgi:hypothetical protein
VDPFGHVLHVGGRREQRRGDDRFQSLRIGA